MRKEIYWLLAGLMLGGAGLAVSAPFPSISQDVGVCDPNSPSHCLAPNASGALPITGTVTATSAATATAAAPTYVEGTVNTLSQDLSGNLRTIIGGTLPAFAVTPAFRQSGSTGTDASANKPTLPNVGANFAASGPYASYILIATVAASATRNNVDIENTSGAQIAIIRDDGTAAAAAAPVNASVFALGGGSGAGAQGGSWASKSFFGRLQIYAPSSGAQVAIMVD